MTDSDIAGSVADLPKLHIARTWLAYAFRKLPLNEPCRALVHRLLGRERTSLDFRDVPNPEVAVPSIRGSFHLLRAAPSQKETWDDTTSLACRLHGHCYLGLSACCQSDSRRPGTMLATGNRDDLPVPSPLAGRAERGARNTAHNFMLFAALAVVAHDRRFRRIRTSQRPAGARRVDRLVKRREDPRFSKLRAYAVPIEIRA
jgi:hypothetical protein